MPDSTPMRIIPDFNVYQNKKSVGTGLIDVALLITNVDQLRFILHSFERNPYYYVSLSLIVCSMIMQVIVGIGLIINSRYNVKNCDDMCKADRANNLINIGIFLITVINIMISAFGIPDNNAPSNAADTAFP